MLARIALFALMAVGLAGFGTVAWISLHPAVPALLTNGAPLNDKVSILVASRVLHAGSLLKPEDLTAQSLSAKDIPPGAQTDSQVLRSGLLGAMIRRTLAAGDVVLPTDTLHPGDRGFLAAVLEPGMRAVTVGVDAVSGLAGLIWPGDRIDLILTQSQDSVGVTPGHRVSGETVLHDVRVIAIDRELMQGATSETPESQAARTVTLEVTPTDAERVAVATRLGHLALAVVAAAPIHPAAANGNRDTSASPPQSPNGVTWGDDVSSALRGGGSTGDNGTVRLYLGPSDSKEIHF